MDDGDDPWVMACLGGGGDLSGQVQGPSNHRPLQGLRQLFLHRLSQYLDQLEYFFWHKRQLCSLFAVRWLTGNDVSGPYFYHLILTWLNGLVKAEIKVNSAQLRWSWD